MPAAPEAPAPWYVRVMLGFAGLIAALFLLAFLGLGFRFVADSPAAAAVVGLALVAGAYALFRASRRGDFAAMFALAASIAGQALFIYGAHESFFRGSPAALWALVAIFEAVLTYAMANYIHRVGSAYAATIAVALALAAAGMGFIAPGVIAATLAWLWLDEARLAKAHSRITPAAYGLTLAFFQLEATALLARGVLLDTSTDVPVLWALVPIGEGLVLLVLLAVVGTLIRRAGWPLSDRRAIVAIVAAAVIGAASLHAPGIAGGLAVVVLGFAAGNAILCGLGIAGLLVYLCGYYYVLDLTLMGKAIALGVTGVTLLVARHVVLRRVLPA